jgi:hypothetical protein
VRHLEAGVPDLAGLLAEDRAQQPLLRGQLGLALRGDLADQDVAVDDLGADPDDAALVQVGQDLVGDVRDVPGDLLRPSLVSRASTSCSSMWIEESTSSCTRRWDRMIASS